MILSNQKEVLFEQIREYIEKYNVLSLLDIGAGDGVLAKRLAEKVKDYTAVEEKEGNIQKLKKLGLVVVPRLFPCEINGEFDMVLSCHSIPEQGDLYLPFLKKAWGLVKEGGIFLVVTFKGGEGDIVQLREGFLKRLEPVDKELFDEVMGILKQFGTPIIKRVKSKFFSNDSKEIVEIASNSIGGSPEEKAKYKDKLDKLILSAHKENGKYFFPFEHLFILVEKK